MREILDGSRWYRDRHDRRAWDAKLDAERTLGRAHVMRVDPRETPRSSGSWTATLFGPNGERLPLNAAGYPELSLVQSLEAGFGSLDAAGHREYAIANHPGWYVQTYYTQTLAVAA